LKITDIKIDVLSVPLSNSQRVSFGKMQSRNTIIIQIITSEGITGIGESWINFPSWGWIERKATLIEGVFPILINQNPLEVNILHEKMVRTLSGVGKQWGALGVIYQAISAVDVALWDILGKTLKSPIYHILGGGSGKPIPIYASGIDPLDGEEIIHRWLDRGVKAFKIKVGLDKQEEEMKFLRKVREIAPNSHIMIDATQHWDVKGAIQFLEQAKDVNLSWVEEPISSDDYEGMKLIQDRTGIPVAAGENIYGLQNFRRLFESNGVTIVQPDVTKVGGISSARNIITLGWAWNKVFAPHIYGSAVGLIAALHIMSAFPGGKMLEVDSTENPLQKDLLLEPLELRDGYIYPPQGYGLGINLNVDFINKYSIQDRQGGNNDESPSN